MLFPSHDQLAERNREKARQRYYKQKEKNKTTNVAKKIVEQTNVSAKQQIKAPNQGGKKERN